MDDTDSRNGGAPEAQESGEQALTKLLGSAVLAWSNLERSIELLTVGLLTRLSLDTDIAVALVANLELRERCKIASALLFYVDLPDSRRKELISAINTVDNELRLARNRFIHDSWKVKENIITRRKSTGTKIIRPQAFKIDLHVPAFEAFELDDLFAFHKQCCKVFDVIADEAERIVQEFVDALPERSVARSPRPRTFWSRLLRRKD